MRIVTFNVQNLRLRRLAGRLRLDGARDGDMAQDTDRAATALDLADRRLTSAILAQADADVICLQEVFDLETLDFFHDHLMRHAGAGGYRHRVCLPGNDGAGRDLAVLSRRPLEDVQSHARLTPDDLGLPVLPGLQGGRPLFRRDCLAFRLGGLHLFLCHFKAPSPDAARAWPIRRAEALAVRKLVEGLVQRDRAAPWLVLGDLNEPVGAKGESAAIAPLMPPFSVDLVARMPQAERWTFYDAESGQYACPDALLAAPALAQRWPETVPQALRAGLDRAATRAGGQRLADVGAHRPHASDHAALLLELAGA